MALVGNSALASCNPRDIQKIESGRYSYSVDCHVEFGRLIQVEKERVKQIEHMNESIKLKDLAIDTSNKRIELWQNTTYKVEDRLIRLEKSNSKTKWVYFGLGALLMSGAVWGAGQLR